jgi:hypothetical protein
MSTPGKKLHTRRDLETDELKATLKASSEATVTLS